jgi:hypothetical protein
MAVSPLIAEVSDLGEKTCDTACGAWLAANYEPPPF